MRIFVLAALATSAAIAQAATPDPVRARQVAPAQTDPVEISYGKDPLQRLSLWPVKAADAAGSRADAPLIVFVHGGGWSRGGKDNATGAAKATHYPRKGYAFASIDYRLVPSVTVEQQAQDVASALEALVAGAEKYGVDRHRIVLMGHSAGAHLVALVGTDEQYLRSAGLRFTDLAGILPIDGAAYDVPAQVAQAGPRMLQTYAAAFGRDEARQRRLSPSFQATAPNAPAFLLIHVGRPDGVAQNRALETALARSGTRVERRQFAGTGLRGHSEINRRLGDSAYPATAVVDEWLDRLFAD